MRNVKFILQLLLGFVLILIAVYSPLNEGGLKRVSVKTTQYLSKSGNYEVLLKNCGGSSGQSKIRHFDNSTCDILFIVVVNGDMYEIPSSEITVKSTLTLTDKWDKYKVSL